MVPLLKLLIIMALMTISILIPLTLLWFVQSPTLSSPQLSATKIPNHSAGGLAFCFNKTEVFRWGLPHVPIFISQTLHLCACIHPFLLCLKLLL